MVVVNIKGISVNFPFEPYEIQKDYMEKVIECLQDECVGVLESPTGTGKTLSLLCSSLAWLETKKAQIQAQHKMPLFNGTENEFLVELNNELGAKGGKLASGRSFLGLPTVIYSSRTHTQLQQAMQELKRTSYKYMRASVLASRDQLCIHPDVLAENDMNTRITMCQLKLASGTCHFYNRVDQKKEDPILTELSVIDIEDIVKVGRKHSFCPYYMTKELQKRADIIFTPYNYLFDPLARKALGLNLQNNVVILDEAHNVEKTCEETTSVSIRSTDIALATDELTALMKVMSEQPISFDDSPKDFTPEEVCLLKEMLLNFEKAIDEVPLNKQLDEGTNFPGDYVFQLLEKAQITRENCYGVTMTIDKITQYLATVNEGQRKGKGLRKFGDFLTVVFVKNTEDFVKKVRKCYKIHIAEEEGSKSKGSNWLSKASKPAGRVLSYWCFSPGFGMNVIMDQNVRSLILTSGTLAPLNPLISELELNVKVRLENPHIVDHTQICVKVLSVGPDGETLNSNYQNRNNPNYKTSLGRSILNLTRVIPGGLLIFFPSYPIMQSCLDFWQGNGMWSNIAAQKAIFVEPKQKEAFAVAMASYYQKIRDPNLKGAIFMGVCRGKVSEGVDFADSNGRAVIIVGLPYPPLKEPRVILKRRYLDVCHGENKEYLTGQDWYCLEATRAVNQAIGRVIRHKDDYGAILLLDQRFNNARVKNELSKWLRNHVQIVNRFGEIIKDLSVFFRAANLRAPAPTLVDQPSTSGARISSFASSESVSSSSSLDSELGDLVTIHKRVRQETLSNPIKKKKIYVTQKKPFDRTEEISAKSVELISLAKENLGIKFMEFVNAIKSYKENDNFPELLSVIDKIVHHTSKDLLDTLKDYIRPHHRGEYDRYRITRDN
ncbi:regulator of telomere elongation helicase 1 homolog [Cylas formicarius]|uniref:regulator of telomere elongation helicase 1 homolog n=1 Tax=Cylas formicarius TaxID=197179 RepID=UPI00295849EE|nr:regulator of telomere elongation helicase 1 homolog [Cylas formicarius]